MGSKIYAKTRFSRSIIQKNLRAPHGRRGQSASRPARPGSHTRGRGPSLRREGPTERQRDPALRRSSRARMYNIQSACTYSAAARFQIIVAAVTPWPRHYRMALCMNTRLGSSALRPWRKPPHQSSHRGARYASPNSIASVRRAAGSGKRWRRWMVACGGVHGRRCGRRRGRRCGRRCGRRRRRRPLGVARSSSGNLGPPRAAV